MLLRVSIRHLLILTLPLLVGCIEGFGEGGDGYTCEPHFARGLPCELECDASDTVIVDGTPYCTSTCGEFGQCPPGHVCAQFGDGADPPSICLPPCQSGSDCPSGFLGICSQEQLCGL